MMKLINLPMNPDGSRTRIKDQVSTRLRGQSGESTLMRHTSSSWSPFLWLRCHGYRDSAALRRTNINVSCACIYIDYIRVGSAAPCFVSTAACYARGLTVAHSTPLGGSTPPRLCVRKLTLKICDFVDISNTLRRSQQCSGARRHLAFVCRSSSP
jgi:hypothetical protein